MAGKEFKAGGDNKHGWVRALLKKFMGSWGSGPTPDTPPPYTPGEKVINESKTLHHKTPLTSRARIMGVDEYGRVLGYISPAYKAASWFNFQPAKKALILEVPIADRNESISSGSEESSEPFRLRMLNPTKAATAGNFHFLGVQLHLAGSNNEQWKLAACDEGKSGPIFKDRANMLRSAVNTKTEGKGPAGNPASSNVWSIHAVEGDCEELRLSWLDKDSVRFPLRAVSDQTPTVRAITNRRTDLADSDVFVIFTILRKTEHPIISGVEDRQMSIQREYPLDLSLNVSDGICWFEYQITKYLR